MDGTYIAGRAAELGALTSLAGDVRCGLGRSVRIVGPAGIGKTTLVRGFLTDFPDLAPLIAAAESAGTRIEFGMIGQLAGWVDPAFRRRAPILAGQIPPHSSIATVSAQLLELLGAVLKTGPVAVVVDDLQWADAGSLLVLAQVLPQLTRRLLTILITRTEHGRTVDPAVEHLVGALGVDAVLELSGLTVDGVGRMARSVLGRDVDTASAQRLHEQTQGHPLHLRTLLQVPGGRQELPVPVSWAAAVQEIRTTLPRAALRLLDALTVLGGRPPLTAVGQVADVGHPEAAVAPAVAAGLVVLDPAPATTVGWTHVGHRDALFTTLSPARRVALHARAADVVAPEQAWVHRVAAADPCDDGLAVELEESAERYGTDGRDDVAARHLQWAAELSSGRPDHDRRLQRACVHLVLGRDRARAEELRTLVAATAVSPLRSLALGLVALLVSGNRAAAEQWLAEAHAVPHGDGASRWIRATATAGLAAARMWSGHDRAALAAARDALSCEELPTRFADYTRVIAAVTRSRLESLEPGLAELDDLPDEPARTPPGMLESLACRGALRAMLGRFPAAQADLRTVIERGHAGAYLISGTTPSSYLAAAQYVTGDWDGARETVGPAMASRDADDPPHDRVLLHVCSSLVPSGRGQWATADARIQAAREAAAELDSPQDRRYVAIAAAVRSQARADPAAMLLALADFRAETSVAGPHVWWCTWWRPLLVEALIGSGLADEARTHLDLLGVTAADARYLETTVVRLSAAAAALAGDRNGALRAAGRHIEHRHPEPAPLARAMLEHDHATRLLTARRRTEAIALLRTARQRFAALGAAPFVARVDADLARTGADGPAPPSGRLTRREYQVAALAATHRTNAEISAELDITVRTVEFHLGNAFRKLGVTGRAGLVGRF